MARNAPWTGFGPDRWTVQVGFSEDHKHVYARFPGIPEVQPSGYTKKFDATVEGMQAFLSFMSKHDKLAREVKHRRQKANDPNFLKDLLLKGNQ